MSAVASPSTSEPGPSNLTPLADLVRKSAKRTRAVYGYEGDGIADGLGQAYVSVALPLGSYTDVQQQDKAVCQAGYGVQRRPDSTTNSGKSTSGTDRT